MSTQDLILDADDLPRPNLVPTPEWPGVAVYVQRAHTADLAEFWAWFSREAREGEALAPWAVCWFSCDDSGKPIFDRKPATARRLAEKAGCVVSRIFHEVDDLNYLTDASREHFRKNWLAGASAAICSLPGNAGSPADENCTTDTPTPGS